MATINAQQSGTLKTGNGNLYVTVSLLTEGALFSLEPLTSPVNATQLFIVQGAYIRLAANPNLVAGPGPTARRELILVDITKANNATEPTLKWAGMLNQFPYTLDGNAFAGVQFANPALKLYIDVVGQPYAGSVGGPLGLWAYSGTPNQLYAYTIVPPALPRLVLYDLANRTGSSVVFTTDNPNLDSVSFNNKTTSLEVTSGRWILYVGTNYPGAINELWVVSATGGPNGDGRYDNATQWGDWATDGNRICSVRALPPTGIVLFENPWFGGRAVNLTSDSQTTDSVGFLNLVSAMVVVSGTWRVFTQPGFQGNNDLIFPKGGFYLSGFYPQNIQWAGDNDAVRSLRLERA